MTNPHFDTDLARGLVGENLVEKFPELLKMGKVEVKTDYRAVETGNFYVETWQYGPAGVSTKKQSGINITHAETWAFVIPQTMCVYYIAVQQLKALLRANNYAETKQPIINAHTNASIGRLVPVTHIARAMLGKYE